MMLKKFLEYLQQAWNIEQYKVGCGSYISIDKIKNNDFEHYDGLFISFKTSDMAKTFYYNLKENIYVVMLKGIGIK